ncbi:hypothetical protein RB213_002079 [Colletotrichum asianum]|uniref:Heterokaryon incompatibility domain-containing protein n=1 Tax=Colletotrichum asianum TaxID=702518 RepID=A0A8H3ZL75_9PEZI|nr:hypothetical protein GQ607_017002 [Colletotrichum asianum]
MWYDYLSVPQWQDALKTRILSAIPEIFQRASFTLVYLEDVTPDIIHRLRHGHSVEERVSGITGICNAKWFSRVWTTMEFVRSSGLRVMIQGYLIQDGVEDVFFSELYQSWDRAVREVGDIHVLEAKIAKIGENKVPWNLGYPDRARKIRKEGKRIDFGLAFALLSRRGCRSSRDFYYALLGLVGSDLTAPPTGDPDEGCLKIQKACLAAGDLSPLLMTPRQGPGSDSFMVKRQGYYDAATFDLGGRTQDPLYPVQFSPSSGRPILTLARIGQVSHLQRAPHLGDHVKNLWKHIYHVIHVTGPDVEQFATSLGVRMFQMDQTAIDSILSDDTRRERLGKLLADWYDFGTFGPEQPPQEWAAEIGNLMYILRRPSWDSSGVLPQIHHVYALGGTVHGDMRFQGCLFGATCSSCHKMFIYRAAVYTRRSEAYGAIAYRIPGLCYSRDTTLPEGVGLLIKDAKIVGRLLWATPACECAPTIEKVSISLDTFNLQEK